jgi:hypothetical protein
MRSTRISIIALSMMVVVPAVAQNSVAAEDSETAAPSPTASDAGEAGAASAGESEAAPPRQGGAKAAGEGEPAPAAVEETPLFGGPAQAHHRFQTGLSIMPGSGYRLIVRYKEGQYCGDSSGLTKKPVCANYVPFFLDLQLSFGVNTRADVILDLRFGLQSDPAAWAYNSHQFAVAPGLRFWIDQEVALKFYTTLQFVYDRTDFKNDGRNSNDVGVRNANGLMWDPIRNVGFFVQFGETMGFMRWFRIDLDIGLGAQLRFP